ncbi:homoserine kinase [Petrotoga halophila]|uniref:Homoserine kinase n=1 Tax=Petrotoga halophila DSM 16923 TaxID=1122953 RepID=A0A2S5EFU8_9BACT|nr:homoserine kinase [Petrotoga halophila]POZ92011.1 serine kinase [Petrotoga halophila DSM 16923]
MIRVKVPATTANIGPGFDSLGIALQLYNIIEVEEINFGLEINVPVEDRMHIETNEHNLVYRAMKRLFEVVDFHPKGLRINLINNIPLARGLGSSAACIAGGLVAANKLLNDPLKKEEIMYLAATMDGHTDNILPALVGGLTVGCLLENEVKYVKMNLPPQLKLLAIIPDFHFSTKKARLLLPQNVPVEEAVFNISRVGLLVASLVTAHFENLSEATKDKIHQPYRKDFIPNWEEITSKLIKIGVKGCFLSGSGPTIMGILDEDYKNIENEMVKFLSHLEQRYKVTVLDVCNQGLEVLNDEGSNGCYR